MSVFVGSFMVIGLYLYSTEIVEFVYLRGAFNISDMQQTSEYLVDLSFAFLLLFVSTILFQPFLTLSIEETKKVRLGMVIFFLFSIVFSVVFAELNSFTSKEGAFLLMYISSIISVVLSGYSYFKYIQYGS